MEELHSEHTGSSGSVTTRNNSEGMALSKTLLEISNIYTCITTWPVHLINSSSKTELKAQRKSMAYFRSLCNKSTE